MILGSGGYDLKEILVGHFIDVDVLEKLELTGVSQLCGQAEGEDFTIADTDHFEILYFLKLIDLSNQLFQSF